MSNSTHNITARSLVMSLFNSSRANTLNINQLIRSGKLFDIEDSAIRMAVTRLFKEQLIESPERGIYQSGGKSHNLNIEIQSWQNTLHQIKPWNKQWLMVLTTHLGRTNKTQLNASKRSFNLCGFAEAEKGVWVRPNNLNTTVNQLYNRLTGIGMPSKAHLIATENVANSIEKSWCDLWPIKTLEANYRMANNEIQSSLIKLSTQSIEASAKESLLLGESIIRQINLDPLLPNEMINNQLRSDVISNMKNYNDIGQQYWQRFLELT